MNGAEVKVITEILFMGLDFMKKARETAEANGVELEALLEKARAENGVTLDEAIRRLLPDSSAPSSNNEF